MLAIFFCFVFVLLASLIPDSQGHCRNLRFTRAPSDGYRLKNHVIRTIDVINEDLCSTQCYLEPNCVSYNFEKKKETNGEHKCDLNNVTYEHNKHAGDLVKNEHYVYRGAENACSKNLCKNNATCQAGFTDKDYQCLCLPGFTGHDCDVDVDECANGTHRCDVNAVCNNTRGSYNCTCKDGFYDDGINCTDIDECSAIFHKCKVGFEENCTAISVPDPIALYPLNSKYETREIDNRQTKGTPVSVSLAAGPDGHPGGSYQFSGQADSYIEFPNIEGIDAQHSITMLCWVYLETLETGNFSCGLVLEISFGNLVARFNNDKELTTTQQLAAKQWHYVGSSYDNSTGNASLWLNGTKVAHENIGAGITLDTGLEVRMGAAANSYELGHFKGRITALQIYDVALTADQINEVKHAGRDTWHRCDVNAVCNNTQGSYNCTCKVGFHGDGKNCNDIDECANGRHRCDVNAVCNNTRGSYNCTCRDGFHGNGVNCTDKDECTNGTHRCDVNALCNNTRGSYYCTCKDGFYGDGKNCTAFIAVFTNLGASRRHGPKSLGSHYTGQHHDGQVTLSSGIQQWTVPYTGEYKIEAVGAAGGYDTNSSKAKYQGRGARMIGTFNLSKGEIIQILVGHRGRGNSFNRGSGGGGGTFVVRGSNTSLIIAGGGGGVKAVISRHAECDASTNTTGNPGHKSGRSNGYGAQTVNDYSGGGGGGGGFYSSGRNSRCGAEGGMGFLQGGMGGKACNNHRQGGFGGGGGGGAKWNSGNRGGGGGGGGYSGGSSGSNEVDSCGGGGGSYNEGKDQRNECCYNIAGHGKVTITLL